ncbi:MULTISPECIES: YciI family protein [unclassified Nonomuraea]|uniref:YciI family protein n=1 Tax=unclassified Nonomuraea TaxID=2593643 RepID=UPI0033F141AC
MLHLLVLRYLGTEEEAGPHVAGHVEYLERHHREGVFLLSGQTVPSDEGGVILARGERAAVERLAAGDPFVRAGVAAYTITTVDPGRVHPALAGPLGVDDARVRAAAP